MGVFWESIQMCNRPRYTKAVDKEKLGGLAACLQRRPRWIVELKLGEDVVIGYPEAIKLRVPALSLEADPTNASSQDCRDWKLTIL